MANKLGVLFKSLQSGLRRKLQLFCLFIALTEFFLIFSLLYVPLLISLFFTSFFVVPTAYLLWFYYDRKSVNTGGHLNWWYRKLPLWRHCAEYFPIKLHKTGELDANKNYIIGYHPHGIVGEAAFFNFNTEATNFSNKFPGITSRAISLSMHYLIPIHRDIVSLTGTCGPSKNSLEWILSKNGKGNAAVIVVGGAEEALDAMPNTMILTLKNKKGFIKMALRYGASLVPCISFGENEIYSHIKFDENSMIRKIQKKLFHTLSFSTPFFYGRGITESIIGYLPYRRPINTIVGRPINVEMIDEPTQEDIDELHSVYVNSLCDLFYTYREEFCENSNMELLIN